MNNSKNIITVFLFLIIIILAAGGCAVKDIDTVMDEPSQELIFIEDVEEEEFEDIWLAEEELVVVEASLLTHLKIEAGGGWTKVTLRGDGSFERYETLSLDNPSMVVVALPGISRFLPGAEKRIDSKELKKVELVRHEGYVRAEMHIQEGSRVVFDVQKSGSTLEIILKGKGGI